MTIWILVILCLGLGASGGHTGGAVRMTVGVLGTWLAFLAAYPLGAKLRPMLMTYFETPTTLIIMPSLLIFLALVAVTYSIAQGVHLKIFLYYKYKTDDEKYSLWERMNNRVGLSLGIVNGILWLGIILAFIYSVGYPIMLSEPNDKAPFLYRTMGKLRNDLKESGFEKFAAAMDRTPVQFYQGSDVIGFMYQNPQLQSRMMHYPLFLSLSGTPEFVKMLAGPETRQILESKTPIPRWLNTNSMKLLNNNFIRSQLKQVDTADLLEFAKTGKSPKYDPELVIGVWVINLAPTLNTVKQNHPQVTPVQLLQLKGYLGRFMDDLVLVNTPDGQMFLRGTKLEFPQVRGLLQARVVAKPTAPVVEGWQPPPPAAPDTGPSAAPSMTDITQTTLIASGRWTKGDGGVNVSLKQGDNEATGTLTVLNEDNITIKINEGTLVFSRYR
ncbi:MAG: hypothetical protein K0Q55_2363 [Verrucomicrobia bacterium]|jgi:hypothetical protein|nr:hypothetical protein [Verrucomicrobiota bacterium]